MERARECPAAEDPKHIKAAQGIERQQTGRWCGDSDGRRGIGERLVFDEAKIFFSEGSVHER
jgi:hypothetical protein